MGIDLGDLSPAAQKQALAKLAAQNPQAAKIAQKLTGNSKYGAVKSWVDGLCFDSNLEAEYFANCKLLTRAGALDGFLYHGKFLLAAGSDSTQRALTYAPDFILCYPDGHYEIIDNKGMELPQFRDKMKLMRERYPNIEIKIEKGKGRG